MPAKFGKQMLGLGVIPVLFVTALVLPFGAPSAAQQGPAHNHASVTNNVVDGRTSPELIKDKDAYRLFLLAATKKDNSPEEVARQRATFKFAHLNDQQLATVVSIMADFKTLHDRTISEFNDRRNAAEKAGNNQQSHEDLKPFIQKRDAAVTKTRTALESVIDPLVFNRFIQTQKHFMVVAAEDSSE